MDYDWRQVVSADGRHNKWHHGSFFKTSKSSTLRQSRSTCPPCWWWSSVVKALYSSSRETGIVMDFRLHFTVEPSAFVHRSAPVWKNVAFIIRVCVACLDIGSTKSSTPCFGFHSTSKAVCVLRHISEDDFHVDGFRDSQPHVSGMSSY